MTTKSYPYNIVVTRDALVLEKLFFDKLGRTNFSDVFSRLNEDEKGEALIVSPRSNNNFISLDLNFPTGGGSTKYVVLKLLETSKLLEYFNVSNTSFEEQLISRAKVTKAVLGSEKLIQDLAKGLRPRFYFSFGMGDDMREWSGPYNLDLIDANISITSDGVRELELMFSPTMGSMLAFTNKLFDDYQYAQSDSIFDTAAKQEVTIRTTKKYQYKENTSRYDPQPKDGWDYCVRDIVSNFISDRFPDVPKGNILVLLPDSIDDIRNFITGIDPWIWLNELGVDIVEGEATYTLPNRDDADPVTPVTTPESTTMQRKAAPQVASITQQIIKRKSSKLIELRSSLKVLSTQLERMLGYGSYVTVPNVNVGPGVPLPLNQSVSNNEFFEHQTAVNERLLRKKTQERLVVSIKEKEKEIKNLEDEISISKKREAEQSEYLASVMEERRQAKAARDSLPPPTGGDEYDLQNPRFSPGYASNVEGYTEVGVIKNYTTFILGMGGTIETSVKDKANTLIALEPLYTFIKGIYDGSERPKDFTILEENDAKILKLLEDYNLIENKDFPVIIFGRLSTIQQLVYPPVAGELEGIGEALEGLAPGLFGSQTDQLIALANAGGIVESNAITSSKAPKGNEKYSEFSWKKYIKDFVKTFKPKAGIRTSSFGEGVGDYYNAIIKLADTAKTDNPLVFTHNIKNSNVLSLSFDSSPYKGELLNYSTESVHNVVDGVYPPGKGEIIKDDSFKEGPLGRLIDIAAIAVANARGFGDKRMPTVDILSVVRKAVASDPGGVQLKLLTPNKGQIKAKTFFDAVLLRALYWKDAPGFAKLMVAPGKSSIEEAEILRKMNKYIINVDIKTLPFFNSPIIPGRKCILYGKPNLIRGATELRGKIKEVPAFFTNAYTIIGYKHRITPTDAYSEFKLIQDSFAQGIDFQNLGLFDFFDKELEKTGIIIPFVGNLGK